MRSGADGMDSLVLLHAIGALVFIDFKIRYLSRFANS